MGSHDPNLSDNDIKSFEGEGISNGRVVWEVEVVGVVLEGVEEDMGFKKT